MQDKMASMTIATAPFHILTPITLEGTVVRLVPMRPQHAQDFWLAAKDALDEIFRWIPYAMQKPEDFDQMVAKTLAEQERGESVAFATVERSSGAVIGSTRFMNIDRVNRRAEIGSTWIAPAWQRTGVNTEAKYLMLRHAFEVWGCIRVEENGCAQSEITQRDPAPGRERGRDIEATSHHMEWARARYGLLQHSRR
jgi:RimJ/RimL family protein N-acetyltransferase